MECPQRKPLRLEAYDYSQPGSYFITICTHARQRLFDDFVGADLCVRPVFVGTVPPSSGEEIFSEFTNSS